jgi:choline dehydrogenase-like flavoprotein
VHGYTFQFGRGVGPVVEAVASEAKVLLPWGAGHHATFRRLNSHLLGLSAICEDLPEERNRVTLDPVLKDSHGIPAPRIDYQIGENTARMMEHGIARAKEILAPGRPSGWRPAMPPWRGRDRSPAICRWR